ncbi:hypothetical protein M885DRAFT_617771 [Pelagophyceae sp. CCMP2097]|nr:hypothetical protein M885DRAFT_617771 [Pelagophyceae sp. CCMP2097]
MARTPPLEDGCSFEACYVEATVAVRPHDGNGSHDGNGFADDGSGSDEEAASWAPPAGNSMPTAQLLSPDGAPVSKRSLDGALAPKLTHFRDLIGDASTARSLEAPPSPDKGEDEEAAAPLLDEAATLLDDKDDDTGWHAGKTVWSVGIVSLAFASLVVINVGILFSKAASQRGGVYEYNPASALAMAECGKLAISVCVWLHRNRGDWYACVPGVPAEAPRAAVGLALLYALNNQLAFYILTAVPASTLGLYRAATPALAALLLWLLYGDAVNKLQWATTIVQAAGLLLVAEGAGGGAATSKVGGVQGLLAASAVATALCCVLNSKALKTLGVPLPLFNVFLYSAGACFNLAFFMLRLAYSDQHCFFGGYSNNGWAAVVVLTGAAVGPAGSVVYKYGDAIISRYAASMSAAVLLVLEAAEVRLSYTACIGAFIVIVTSAVYLDIAVAMDAAPWPFAFAGAFHIVKAAPADDRTPLLPRKPPRLISCRAALANTLAYVVFIVVAAATVCHFAGHETIFNSAWSKTLV